MPILLPEYSGSVKSRGEKAETLKLLKNSQVNPWHLNT